MKQREKRDKLVPLMFTLSKYNELKQKAKDKGMTLKQYILNHFIQE